MTGSTINIRLKFVKINCLFKTVSSEFLVSTGDVARIISFRSVPSKGIHLLSGGIDRLEEEEDDDDDDDDNRAEDDEDFSFEAEDDNDEEEDFVTGVEFAFFVDRDLESSSISRFPSEFGFRCSVGTRFDVSDVSTG